MARLEGAYSVVALSGGELAAFRDPLGFRPLCLGRLPEGDWVVASETCALDLVGADLRAGGPARARSWSSGRRRAPLGAGRRPPKRAARCASSSSSTSRGPTRGWPRSRSTARDPHGRAARGRGAGRRRPRAADPRLGTPAAIGFAGDGIPFSEGLIKNRYVGRTFIQPDQGLRQLGVHLKFNPVAEIAGKRVVIVDDSIVRGNTTRQLVAMLFDAGAAEVHVRVSSPPIVGPCFYGIDLADPDELVAASRTVEEVRELIGATSLAYLSLEGLQAGDARPESALCRACLTGDYPTAVPVEFGKLRFEPAPA